MRSSDRHLSALAFPSISQACGLVPPVRPTMFLDMGGWANMKQNSYTRGTLDVTRGTIESALTESDMP